jgi:hypothetical protein
VKDYEPILDKYALEGYSMYSKMIPASKWGNKEVANGYLERYWMPLAEYQATWQGIQNRVFINQDVGLPALMFAPQYEMLVIRGGCLFVEDEFRKLQECFLTAGDSRFAIVENSFGGKLDEPALRMVYPADITWEEMTSGNFISAILLEYTHKEYFVFGDSESWGKYAANDYVQPLEPV